MMMAIQETYPAASRPLYAIGQRVMTENHRVWSDRPLFVLGMRYVLAWDESEDPGVLLPGVWGYLLGRVQEGPDGLPGWYEWGWLPEGRVDPETEAG